MFALALQAYWKLIVFDSRLLRSDFRGLYRKVRQCPLDGKVPAHNMIQRVCYAVDMACIWYWKEVLCLQRSAATACLLRQHGVSAQMVIGAQQVPFKAHAWVEVDGRVVNDKPYMAEIYGVLDRC
jgi:hypothetical protein